MDPYATLGVEPEASDEDIKRAFRRLSLTYHPDRWLDDDEKRVAGSQWLRIASAYDTLSDTKKRMVRVAGCGFPLCRRPPRPPALLLPLVHAAGVRRAWR